MPLAGSASDHSSSRDAAVAIELGGEIAFVGDRDRVVSAAAVQVRPKILPRVDTGCIIFSHNLRSPSTVWRQITHSTDAVVIAHYAASVRLNPY